MKRLFFLIVLTLLSANTYAYSGDEFELEERMKLLFIITPWFILCFLAISNISDSKHYQTAMQILLILVAALSFAWLTGYIEF